MQSRCKWQESFVCGVLLALRDAAVRLLSQWVHVYLSIVDMVVQVCHHVCMAIHTCIRVPQIAGQDFECVLCLAVSWLLVEKNSRERHHTPQAVFSQLTDPAWSPPSTTSVCATPKHCCPLRVWGLGPLACESGPLFWLLAQCLHAFFLPNIF